MIWATFPPSESRTFPGKVVDSKAGAQKIQNELGTFCARSKEESKNDGGRVKIWPSLKGPNVRQYKHHNKQ